MKWFSFVFTLFSLTFPVDSVLAGTGNTVVVIPIKSSNNNSTWNQSAMILDSNDNLIGYEIEDDKSTSYNTWPSSTRRFINSKGYISQLNEYIDGKWYSGLYSLSLPERYYTTVDCTGDVTFLILIHIASPTMTTNIGYLFSDSFYGTYYQPRYPTFVDNSLYYSWDVALLPPKCVQMSQLDPGGYYVKLLPNDPNTTGYNDIYNSPIKRIVPIPGE